MSTETPTRRRRLRLAAALVAAAALAAGALFWASGDVRHDAALDSACDGTLAAAPVRELVDGAEVTAEVRRGHGDSWWQCRVSEADADEEDGRIDLRVTVSGAGDRRSSVQADRTDAPLGRGWTGGFAFDPDRDSDDRGDALATVLLGCAGRPGDGFVAEVRARTDRLDFGRPEERARLAAVLTGTATAYARQEGCRVAEGEPVRQVGVSVNAWDYRPFASVSGSCAGLVDAPTAARWGVRTAVETAVGPKPQEGCVLGGLKGAPLYTFTASYGPALDENRRDRLESATARPGDHPDGRYALWSRCHDAVRRAAYDVYATTDARDTSPLSLDHPALRAALQRFADRSAKAHGCDAPSTEPVDDLG
ncbi:MULTISPECIES: hypothetical protein [unclassified Streptomyces]|uniref:hypothetical protein n=1 Tax=unclassified Streptomyces TaxID=2593676 RepID=UPI002E373453|nr:hypothetical protein [Streptomyces sp. NBC_01268]